MSWAGTVAGEAAGAGAGGARVRVRVPPVVRLSACGLVEESAARRPWDEREALTWARTVLQALPPSG